MGQAGASIRSALTRLVDRSIPPAVVLLAPFAAFLRYQEYGFGHPEILVCLVVLAGFGVACGVFGSIGARTNILMLALVVTLFVDLQFDMDFWIGSFGKAKFLAVGFLALVPMLWVVRQHAGHLIAIVAATVLLSTVLLPSDEASKTAPPAARRSDLPVVVHVVLDEHIGIEGMPAEKPASTLAADLRSFYEGSGFHLFGAAYSEHNTTERSLSNLFNFSVGRYRTDLIRGGGSRSTYQVNRNEYFATMVARGFALRVYQSNHIDLCPPDLVAASCETYNATQIAAIRDVPQHYVEKARLVLGTFLDRSKIAKLADTGYEFLAEHLDGIGIRLPKSAWLQWTVGLASRAEARRFADDLSSARHGDFFFAHLLLPHAPFIYDAACKPLPLTNWITAYFDTPRPPDRATAYTQYASQVRCTTQIVRTIIEAIPRDLRRDAIVIVHGDHGSRISSVEPTTRTAASMSAQDYADNYSTLFAVRGPGVQPGYDARLKPISCILSNLVAHDFRSLDGIDACAAAPTVFVSRTEHSFVPSPLLSFVHTPS